MTDANKYPPRTDIIAELIERDRLKPFLDTLAAFATAQTRVPHVVKNCAFVQDKDNPRKMTVKVDMDVRLPEGTEMEYLWVRVPILCPMPRGTLFEKDKQEK